MPTLTRALGTAPRLTLLEEGGSDALCAVVADHFADAGARVRRLRHPRNDRTVTWLWTLLRRPADVFYAMGVQLRGNRFRAAKRLGRRTVLHWIGTDVWYMRTDPDKRETFRRDVLPHIDAHWVVAPVNAEELRVALGVEATVIPIVDYRLTDVPEPTPPTRHAVLTYVSREDATAEERYGLETFLAVARRFPDTPFRVVGHGGGGRDVPANVTFLGRTDDMPSVYRDTSVYVRIRHQDGLPKLVLESLAWGREVVFTDPFPHCRRAHAAGEVAAALEEIFRRPPALNRAGREHVLTEYSRERVSRKWRDALDALCGPASS